MKCITTAGEHQSKPFVDINPFKKVPAVQDEDLLILER